ncbi:phage tail protein [Vibrio jasicida]|uniref:phage tail protein n=1 Tax=Vibrio jasicida TaxID=766224 RepID=UPI000CE406C1|nr:tail fiber protein [Vibrio jasicida]
MATEPFLGTMTAFAGDFSIRGFALCKGQTVSIADNQALFSLLGTTYGGDGRSTFQLPDLRGRSLVGIGQRPGGLNYVRGEQIGNEQVIVAIKNMPQHSHSTTFTPQGGITSATLQVATNKANTEVPDTDSYLAQNTSDNFFKPGFETETLTNIKGMTLSGGMTGGTVSIGNTGGSQPLNILNPALPISWQISMTGAYPSRND